MNSFFITALHQYGYPALWVIIFIAAVGAPISGNLLLYAAGAFAAFDDFNIFVLFLVAVSAAVMGMVGYLIGWKLGNPLLVWLEKEALALCLVKGPGARIVLPAARCLGGVYFPLADCGTGWPDSTGLLGAERYPYGRFLVWDVSGQILGALIPLGIGYTFAASWGEAESLFGSFSDFVLAFLVTMIIAVALVRSIRARKRARATFLAKKSQMGWRQTQGRSTILRNRTLNHTRRTKIPPQQ